MDQMISSVKVTCVNNMGQAIKNIEVTSLCLDHASRTGYGHLSQYASAT